MFGRSPTTFKGYKLKTINANGKARYLLIAEDGSTLDYSRERKVRIYCGQGQLDNLDVLSLNEYTLYSIGGVPLYRNGGNIDEAVRKQDVIFVQIS